MHSTIKEELGWKASSVGNEHTDCMINPVKSYLRYQRWGFGAKTQKLAALIRDGQLSRESSFEQLQEEQMIPENLDYFMKELELDSEMIEKIKKTHHGEFIH